jgi:3-oxoacyl-[acyl-carrier protein] reductase
MNAPLPSTDVAVVPDLKGKAVLITGASTGIGAAAARAFGRNGARVALNFNASGEAAEAVAAECKAKGAQVLALAADVSKDADAKRIVDELQLPDQRANALRLVADGVVERYA